MKKEFNVDAELIKGGGGIFDVKVDGELVYSKHQTGGFPDNAKLVEEIKRQKTAH